mmetsp:Transcript_3273/g.8095  ORF Transcript_3273/g.8095 Transcript_3273/m.8095 type:complete len:227 (+) Transcript_3273:74-754(+)
MATLRATAPAGMAAAANGGPLGMGRDKENGALAAKENQAAGNLAMHETKTPARRQRQALGNITNKTPSATAQKGNNNGKTPASASQAKGLSVSKLASAGRFQQAAKTPSAAHSSARQETRGVESLAREIERRANIFAEDGVEHWMGDSYDRQALKRANSEAKEIRENVQDFRCFMDQNEPFPNRETQSCGDRILEREACEEDALVFCGPEDVEDDVDALLAKMDDM